VTDEPEYGDGDMGTGLTETDTAGPDGRNRRIRVVAGLLTAVLVVGLAVAAIVVFVYRATPADVGKYRLVLPRSVDGGPLDTTSKDAAHLRATSVFGTGYLSRFTDAVPVTAVYDWDGQSWLYVWGAYGKIADPAGELTAFWDKYSTLPPNITALLPDAEPAGPLGGYLQCLDDFSLCVWADHSSIVVVSLEPPRSGVILYGPAQTEQQLAAVTLSLRNAAEVPAQRAPATAG